MWYNPEANLSIDEQMARTRCGVAFIQYMLKKPTKFRKKLWILCEAETRHCLKFQIYTGKMYQCQEYGLAHSVVFDLMADVLDKSHHLYLVNFYSTVKLEQRSTYACGTTHNNRGRFPADFKGNLQQGEFWFHKVGKLMAVHWKDKRDAYSLSIIHST